LFERESGVICPDGDAHFYFPIASQPFHDVIHGEATLHHHISAPRRQNVQFQ
jgi:hypothetical protein